VLNRQSLRMTDRVSSGLQLSLQGQNILYIQAFDDARRQELANILEKEKWKGSNLEFRVILDRVETLPSIMDAFKEKQVENGENNNEEDISTLMEKFPGAIIICGEPFIVPDAAHDFVLMLIDYCELCALLPSTSTELGLKVAELMKFFNSRICQLIIGAGAISVSGLKTITIRNLALAQRAVQLVMTMIPFVRKHFEECHSNRRTSEQSVVESKQLETFRKQFEQAYLHLKNHSDEVEGKILVVVNALLSQHLSTWQPSNQLPSANFKALCRQLTKLNESVSDIWTKETLSRIMLKVHEKFISAVKSEIRTRKLEDPDHRHSIILLSELTFYTQSLLLLNVIPPSKLTRDAMEYIWFDL